MGGKALGNDQLHPDLTPLSTRIYLPLRLESPDPADPNLPVGGAVKIEGGGPVDPNLMTPKIRILGVIRFES